MLVDKAAPPNIPAPELGVVVRDDPPPNIPPLELTALPTPRHIRGGEVLTHLRKQAA